MKILVLNGSPKKKSDTIRLTNAFTDGIKSGSEAQVEQINLIEKQIAPCMGCFGCWQTDSVKCVIDDYQNTILDKICTSDVVIWSFPLYCYSFPSHMKAVIDRLLPLSKMNMHTDGETVDHECKEGGSAVHIMISGCGFPSFEDNFAALKMQFDLMFGKGTLKICVSEAPMLNSPAAAVLADKLLEQFRIAGTEYAKHGYLSDETHRILETPMIPAQQYIDIVNGEANK